MKDPKWRGTSMLVSIIVLVIGGVVREYMDIAVPQEFFYLCILVINLLYLHLLFTDFRKGGSTCLSFFNGANQKKQKSHFILFCICGSSRTDVRTGSGIDNDESLVN